MYYISIHALLAESDIDNVHSLQYDIEISIHALLAESDRPFRVLVITVIEISIHALLAESDVTSSIVIVILRNFYPRSPCGERLNFLRPTWAATVISIHALLAESDGADRPRG